MVRRSIMPWAVGLAVLLGVVILFAFTSTRAGRITVAGRITDAQGQPLVGIPVCATPQPFAVPWSENLVPPVDPREFRTVTDDQGRYRLKGLSARSYRAVNSLLARLLGARSGKSPQEYELIADARGFALQKILISTDKGDVTVDFSLQLGVTLVGRALDTAGRPLALRNVCLVSKDNSVAQTSSPKNVVPWGPATDATGMFRLERVPPAKYDLQIAVYPEHGWHVAQSATNGLILLVPGEKPWQRDFFFEAAEGRGAILGHPVDAVTGNPVEAFSVKITQVDMSGAGSPVYGCARVGDVRQPLAPSQKVSFKRESFLIEQVSPGLAVLEVSADGYAAEKTQVTVAGGQTNSIKIAMQPEGVLKGRAVRQGNPCAYGYVNLRPVDATGGGLDAQTDARGDYEFRGLKSGDYIAHFCVWLKEGKCSAQVNDIATVCISAGQTNRFDMDFVGTSGIKGRFKAPDKSLRWFVVLEDASPAGEALLPDDRCRGVAWKIEHTGSYSVEGLPAGTYKVIAKCLRQEEPMTPVTQTSRTIVLKPGEIVDVDFDLSKQER